MPCPRRSLLVRWETAARNTSGADEWLYSSRKWCSTTHAVCTPMRSASSHCSTALASTVASASVSQGRGSWCSKNRPILMARSCHPCESGEGVDVLGAAQGGDVLHDLVGGLAQLAGGRPSVVGGEVE